MQTGATAKATEDAVSGPPPSQASTKRRSQLSGRWAWLTFGLMVAVIAGSLVASLFRPDPEPFRIALVAPQTGAFADRAEEQVRAAELTVDQVNEAGGIDGRDVELVVFDDGNDAGQAVEVAERIVADNRIVLVIGHNDSETSIAAGEIYRAAGIPAISPAAAADAVTVGNDWYFGVVVPTSAQGDYMAAYANTVLGHDRVSVVRSDTSALGDAFATAWEGRGGTIAATWNIESVRLEASVADTVGKLRAAQDPGLLVLALTQPEAQALIPAIRDAGSTVPVLLAPSLGYDDFPDLFEDLPREQQTPGFYTEGIYAASPMIYDSIGGRALVFADAFRERYDTSPDWFGAKVNDAITVGSAAIERAGIEPGGDAAEDRQRVHEALVAVNSPETAVEGLSSQLYFNGERHVPQSLSIGRFHGGHITSEPIQYALITDPGHLDLEADRQANLLLEIGDDMYRQYRVVYVGMDINELSNLDTAAQTYTTDFFLWMRYTGEISATDIVFTNATDPSLSLGDPLQRNEDGGETYAMFRVQGTFGEPLDFHDYPWDTHQLGIGFQNKTLDDHDIVYVADAATLFQSQEERLLSGIDLSQPFNSIPNWEATRVWFSQEPQISRSVLLDDDTNEPGYVQFSEFQVDITYVRDVQSFLIKNLLPLGLLALVTYISLFFPAEQAGARTGFAITSILTSSVLLGAISSRLPDIGYTVAIEWGFYIYIGLSAVLVLFNIVVERLYTRKRFSVVKRLDYAARILYPAVVLGVVVMYALQFG